MAKFKNIRTGNIVSTDNKATIALMEKSPNYAPVTAKGKAAKEDKKADGANGADGTDNGKAD